MIETTTVVLYVSGGTVQGARSDGKSPVAIEVFDVDDLKSQGLSSDEIEQKWKQIEQLCPTPLL